MDRFRIGNLCFTWDSCDYKLNKGPYFEKFRILSSEGMEEIRFKGILEPIESYSKNEFITGNYSYEVYKVDNTQFYIYHWSKNRYAFGIWPELIDCDKENLVYFNPKLNDDMPMTTDWFFGLIGLHKALLQKERPIIHGSYIDYNGEAIIFTAPSQTGKSTQADLWSKYAGAEVINGDRVLLGKKDGKWHAYGYPSCGSSNICVNRTLPIRAIVILEQGKGNKVWPVSFTDRVRSLMAAIEVYKWDLKELEQSLNLAQQIGAEVDVVKLSCRPDADAVEVLNNYLKES